MKIGFFMDDITKVGGIERVTSNLLSELSKNKDLNIEIISVFKGRSEPEYPFPENVPIRYISESAHGDKPHSLYRALNMLSQIKKIRHFFKKNNYDLILAQSFPPAVMVYIAGVNPKRLIAAEHVYAGYYGNLINRVRDYIYKRIAKVVVLTSRDKLFFTDRGLGDIVEVIPNPILPTAEKLSSCSNKRIITVGRLVYQKAHDNLIRCFKNLHEKYPDWVLDIYGDGPLKNDLETLIRQEGLDEVVRLKGLSNNIPYELSESSIFVLSSHFEGFSMVLAEAMNQGVPCVSYDCPNGPSDIVKTGVNGILVENQNLEKLQEGLESLMKSDEFRKSLGKAAPETVTHFSKEKIAIRWIELFINVVNSQPRESHSEII